MKIVYMGTPDFAVPALNALISSHHDVCAVFCQPDKPKGRKMIMTAPEVKVCAVENNIPVYQPQSFKNSDATDIIKKLNPDIIVVAAYGKILPTEVLETPKYGCINIHGSLLPKYRGAAPIQKAVLDGEKYSGVTIMRMAQGIDTGDMIMSEKTQIKENETSGELFDRLANIGAELVLKALDAFENNTVTFTKQDESKATHTSKIDKSACPIDFSKTNIEVHNKVRGLNPWPVATCTFNGKRLKVYSTHLKDNNGEPGKVVSVNPLIVACKKGSVEILEIQPEGKKRMLSKAFVLGHKIEIGDSFC